MSDKLRVILKIGLLLLFVAFIFAFRPKPIYAACCGCNLCASSAHYCDDPLKITACSCTVGCPTPPPLPNPTNTPRPPNYTPQPTTPGSTPLPTDPGGGGGGGTCSNPASCSSDDQCCSGFGCDETEGPGGEKPSYRCIQDVGCTPNHYDCRQGSCVGVCGTQCKDCTGCDPGRDGWFACCSGGGTSCCCYDRCNPSDANACQAPAVPTNTPSKPSPTPHATIRGKVFEDKNRNGIKDGNDDYLEGVKVRFEDTTRNTLIDFTEGGDYTIDIKINTNYDVLTTKRDDVRSYIKPCSDITEPSSIPDSYIGRYLVCVRQSGIINIMRWSPSGLDGSPSDTINLSANENFFLDLPLVRVDKDQSWWQVNGGSVLMSEVISIVSAWIPIPYDETKVPYFFRNINKGLADEQKHSRGIIFYEDTLNLGNDTRKNNYPQVKASPLPQKRETYKSLLDLVTSRKPSEIQPQNEQNVTNPQDGGCKKIQSYTGQSSYNIIANIAGGSCGDGPFIYFFDNNVNINNDINLGSKMYVFVTSGSFNIGENVERIDGVYMADNKFDASDGEDIRLNINGMVYAQDFDMDRESEEPSFYHQPMYILNYQPQYILPLSSYFGTSRVEWREVAP